jgi:peptidoglycan hydrolase-like protein with peptidoglycan-binding domain
MDSMMRAGARNGRINNYSKTTLAKKEVVKEVKILQTHMNRLGFNSGPVDGILGPITDGAIKRMQKFLGTYQDGLVGPITRSLINNSCGK